MRISDWSSDVCSSDLLAAELVAVGDAEENILDPFVGDDGVEHRVERAAFRTVEAKLGRALARDIDDQLRGVRAQCALVEEGQQRLRSGRSEEHTSELQSLMRISYAVFCLNKRCHTVYIT